MPPNADDSLSNNTSLHSISEGHDFLLVELEKLLREVRAAGGDSAISLSSSSNEGSDDASGLAKKRRLSTQSSSNSKSGKKKVHKRVLAKQNQTVQVKFHEEGGQFSLNVLRQFMHKIYLAPTLKTACWSIEKPEGVKKLVYCFVPGLVRNEFIEYPTESSKSAVCELKPEARDKFPFIYLNFTHGLASAVPGDKRSLFPPLVSLTNLPLTKREKQQLLQELKNRKITIKDLCLNKKQLTDREYPIHSQLGGPELPPNWVETEEFDHSGSTIFAVDCEFCQSNVGSVLARISIVNFQGEVVLDTFVKPENDIVDYVTKYSGITEELLKDITTTHKDIQQKFKEIVSSSDILIGHSLESDLGVLRIRHPNVVDTAYIYEHPRGPPAKPSLRWLTQKYLERNIQQGEQSGEGHSLIEDSIACLDLVKMKIQNGEMFGRNCDEVSIFERIRVARETNGLAPVKALVLDYFGISYDTEVERRIVPSNDDDLVDHFKKQVDQHDIVVLSLRQLEADLGWSSAVLQKTNNVEESYRLLNKRLDMIYSLLPPDSIFALTAPIGGDNHRWRELNRVRQEFRNIEKQNKDVSSLDPATVWDFDKDVELQNEVQQLRKTVSFIKVKTSVH